VTSWNQQFFGFGQNICTVMTKNEMKLFSKLKKISKFWKDSLNFQNQKIEEIYIFIYMEPIV
jgi:hypothetical protein